MLYHNYKNIPFLIIKKEKLKYPAHLQLSLYRNTQGKRSCDCTSKFFYYYFKAGISGGGGGGKDVYIKKLKKKK